MERFFYLIFSILGLNTLFWSRNLKNMWKFLSSDYIEFSISNSIKIREIKVRNFETCERLLYISDIHLHPLWEERLIKQLYNVIKRAKPSVILFGGDLVEDSRSLDTLFDFLNTLTEAYPVLVVPGNHDVVVGEEKVKKVVLRTGAIWLMDQSYEDHATFNIIGNLKTGRF